MVRNFFFMFLDLLFYCCIYVVTACNSKPDRLKEVRQLESCHDHCKLRYKHTQDTQHVYLKQIGLSSERGLGCSVIFHIMQHHRIL